MSINVTVHGNPISIKRGRMVSCDADPEFVRRRRIRLQQVRQQSREIAADVRNRVRKEKEKQLSKAEKDSEEHVKRWKTRKLLDLQQQYQDCVQEIGSAHRRAASEKDPHEVISEVTSKNQTDAILRGKLASEKQKNDHQHEKLLAAKPAERRQQVKKIENARSEMVSKLGKNKPRTPSKKKKRKSVTDVTISSNIVSVSESSENSVSDIENISSNVEEVRESIRKHKHSFNSEDSISPKQTSDRQECSPICDSYISDELPTPPSILSDFSASDFPLKTHGNVKNKTLQLSPSKINDIIEQHRPINTYPVNTRISDHIKQRKFTHTDPEINNFHFISNNIQPETSQNRFQIESYKICDIPSEKVLPTGQLKESNLPYVAPTTVLNTEDHEIQSKTEQNYNRFTGFRKDYTTKPIVQKINKGSISVRPPTDRKEQEDYFEQMQRRDFEAHCRGKKALEKTKIQKDYKQLLHDLPVLQRQERLASMRTHNPTFHMSDDRFQDLERRKQNRIENLFEKYYHKCKNLETPLITIKPVQKSPPGENLKLPFTALDMTESPVQLNVAEWNNCEESPKENSTSLRREKGKTSHRQNGGISFNQDGVQSSKQNSELDSREVNELADLLQRVNKQRELLLQEVSNLPASSDLQKILQDEELLKIACPCPAPTKVSEKKVFVSTATSPLAVLSPKRVKSTKIYSDITDSKRELEKTSSESSLETTKKRHKKPKVKKHKILLRNEETQTSPASYKSSSPKESLKHPSFVSSYKKSTTEETKSKSTETDPEKLCEIIIKLADESSVKITSCPSAASRQTSPKRIDASEHKKPAVKTIKSKPILKQKTQKPKILQPMTSTDVSTSTAYMSPPDLQKKKPEITKSDHERLLYKDMLGYKPQQTNIDKTDSSLYTEKRVKKGVMSVESTDSTEKNNINHHILKYIQKLLHMSRRSIDELTVSSASDVSTPGPNVVESVENGPLVQLHNVMSHFNLSFTDIQKYLSVSNSSNSSADNIEATQKDFVEKKVEIQEPAVTDSDELVTFPYSDIIAKFSELAQTSCDKISNLTSMIDKIRLEKEKLLSPISSERNDNSITSYMDLPKFTSESTQTENVKKQDEPNSSDSTISQGAIDRYLLAVGETSLSESYKYINGILNSNPPEDEFIPMLDGIPKYEEAKPNQEVNYLDPALFKNIKTKPPPSLLRNAAKYSINIDMTPHELSTIVELDTVTSSRNVSEIGTHRAKSPDEKARSRDNSMNYSNREHSSTHSEYITISPERVHSPPKIKSAVELKKDTSVIDKSKKISPKSTKKDKNPQDISGVQPLSSDKSSSSEDREAALIKMGLSWAVSTLKKTQESLALSSSSSGGTSSKKHVSFKDSSSNSDVSLKDVLSKQFLRKLSSSSLLTDSLLSSEGSPYISDMQDLSEIAGAVGTQSRDRSQQRTSTPVQYSKSTDSKNKSKDNNLFTGDSELSSVRLLSDDNLFLSIPNLTLDTNKSLNKSKK